MENILDLEYALRPVDPPDAAALEELESLRRSFGSERDTLFQLDEEATNFRLYGPPFEGASAPEPPEWGRFVSDAQSHFAKKGKDMWVSVWLTEVLLCSRGFQGLAEGFELMRMMCQDHWNSIVPSPDGEDGPAYTVKLLSAVSKRSAFIDAIRLSPITEASGLYAPASCATIDDIEDSERGALIGETSDEFISDVHQSMLKAIQEWQALDDVLEERCGDEKPPSAKIRETLEGCLTDLRRTYPQLLVEAQAEEESTAVAVTDQGGGGDSQGLGGNLSGDSHLKNREQAFKTLEMVSRYFAENEPSSPVSTALKQAIRWGRMSFSELLKEVVDDESVRDQILRLTGSQDASNDEDEDY